MKITKSQLKSIIKEVIEESYSKTLIEEYELPEGVTLVSKSVDNKYDERNVDDFSKLDDKIETYYFDIDGIEYVASYDSEYDNISWEWNGEGDEVPDQYEQIESYIRYA